MLPGGRPATDVLVSLHVGPQKRPLRIEGERNWQRDISGEIVAGPPEPFLTSPFRYEDAFGGYDASGPDPRRHVLHPANPVGSGVAASKATLLGRPASRVHVVDGQASQAAGFGPTASHWAPRVKFAGTYDGAWFRDRKPLLPLDYDPRVHLCAPLDQEFIPHLRDGVPVSLSSMSPSGQLSFADFKFPCPPGHPVGKKGISRGGSRPTMSPRQPGSYDALGLSTGGGTTIVISP